MLLLKLGWRNIFRNKKRTILASIVIGIGLMALLFTDALVIGMERAMIRIATETFLGQGQIHHKRFQKTLDVDLTIPNLDQVREELQSSIHLKSFSLRTLSFAMISSSSDVSSIILYGIQSGNEKEMTKIFNSIIEGKPPENDPNDPAQKDLVPEILIGKKLSETLEVEIGDRIVVTVAQARTGELSQELFRVGGIFKIGSRKMDSSMAFISFSYAQKMLGLKSNEAHEIILKFKDINFSDKLNHPFWKKFPGNEILIQSWRDILKGLSAAMELNDYSTAIVAAILFIVVSLSIMNTLFMSLYERIFEFGVIRAIGTRPFQMFLIIMAEAASLAILSIIVGSALGLGITYYVSITGIDYMGMEYGGITIQELLYPEIHWKQYIIYPISVFVFTLVAAVYPAIYAARLTPANAMRKVL